MHPLPLPFDPAALPETVRVALVEAAPVYFAAEQAWERTAALIRHAAEAGADLIAFPESWWGGYPAWVDSAAGAALWEEPGMKQLHRLLLAHALTLDSPYLERLCKLARQCEVDIALGANERHGRSLLNSIFLMGREGTCKVRRKLVPTHGERLVWAGGHDQDFTPLPTAYGGVSAAICWEHWMPELRAVLHRGEALFHVAAWPVLREPYRLASRHFAFEGRCFVLATAARLTKTELLAMVPADAVAARDLLMTIPAGQDERILSGGAAVYGPDGRSIPAEESHGGDLHLWTVRPAVALEAAATLDVAGHYSRPDLITVTLREGEP